MPQSASVIWRMGQLMNKTGVTETIIKKSAELGGDKPLVITLIIYCSGCPLYYTFWLGDPSSWLAQSANFDFCWCSLQLVQHVSS